MQNRKCIKKITLHIDPKNIQSREYIKKITLHIDPKNGFQTQKINRAISTGQLNTLLCLHIRPINVVVFHGPQTKTYLKGGFPLICFQRLSRPYLATQRCSWQNNWYTSDTSNPVLSY